MYYHNALKISTHRLTDSEQATSSTTLATRARTTTTTIEEVLMNVLDHDEDEDDI